MLGPISTLGNFIRRKSVNDRRCNNVNLSTFLLNVEKSLKNRRRIDNEKSTVPAGSIKMYISMIILGGVSKTQSDRDRF